jgi:AcrR family transcriptional regulator
VSAPSAVGRREHRKSVTRRELLAAGRKLFGEQGLYDSRIEDLTRHAGIAKGTLYGYFGNKEELMAAVVTSALDELLGHVHRGAGAARTYPERLECVVQAHLDFYDANPDLMLILHQVRGLLKFDRPEGAALRPLLARYLAELGRVVSSQAPGARQDERDALESATVLFGAVSGVASIRAALSGPVPRASRPRATARAIVALVLAYEVRVTP